jgi:dihydroflavonol-4-reductase
VRVLLLPGEDQWPLEGQEVELVEGDVLDLDSLRIAANDVEMVYHLAGVISVMGDENPEVWRVNVLGTQNLLKVAREMRVRRLVYTSSIHALRRMPHGFTIDEAAGFDLENGIGAYDRSKAIASLAVLQAVEEGLDAVIVCPTGVIGPYDFRGSETGLLIQDCMKSPVQFCLEGAYDFVDVRDVADGLILACERGQSGQFYILSGEKLSLVDLVETVQQATSRRRLLIHIPLWLTRFAAVFTPLYYRLSHVRPRLTIYALDTVLSNSIISHRKAQQELGYHPRPLNTSIGDTIQWFQESGPVV